jgi:hypothetical protein
MSAGPALLAAVVVAVTIGGCTHDFGTFEAHGDATTSDASSDTSSDGTASDTTACTPQHTCIVDAQTCAASCDSTETTCVDGCGGSPSCRNHCHDTANGCRSTCATACTTCTTNAGCPAPTDCTAAAK